MTFPLIDWLFVENLLLRAVTGTFQSTLIAVALMIIGAPLSLLLSRLLGRGRLTGPLALICGVLVLSVVTWYAFSFTIGVRIVYLILIAAGISASLTYMGFLVATGTVREKACGPGRLALGDAAIFLVIVLAYNLLSFAKIVPGALPLLSSGNNDLLAYLKCGQSLLYLPNANPVGGGSEILHQIKTDVFGAFNLVALASFILNADVEKCAIPVLGFAIGLVSLGIGTVCRQIFKLPLSISISICVLFTTSPLFSYLILNYFLAQILFQGILLAALFHLAEVANGRPGSLKCVIFFLLASSILVLFVYPVWFLQFMALTSAGVGAAVLYQEGRLRLSAIGKAASLSLGMFVALNLGTFFIGTSHYFIGIGKLGGSISSFVVGWPLPFINLNLLMGIPDRWVDTPNLGMRVWRQVVPALLICALSTVVFVQNDKGADNKGRRFMLSCFAASVILYLIVWKVYGESYRQWKFATTLSLPLGFVVVSSAFFSLQNQGRKLRSIALIAIAFCISGNLYQYFRIWSVPVVPFGVELSKLSVSDADDAIKAVYIDIPGISQRMAAALFVKNKPVLFGGPTYFNEEDTPQPLPDGMIAVMRERCSGNGEASEYSVNNFPSDRASLPMLPVGDNASLSRSACLKLQGFSFGEPWGRWTNGKTASIRVHCVCDVSDNRMQIVINAGAYILPGIVERQRVVFRVNGSAPQERELVSAEKVDIVLDVPADIRDPNLISVGIELPDATSPAAGGVPDTRLLGLSIVNFVIRQS